MNRTGLLLVGGLILLIAAGAAAFFLLKEERTEPAPLPMVATTTPNAKETKDSGQYYDITVQSPREVEVEGSASTKATAQVVIDSWVTDTIKAFKDNGNLDALTPEDIKMQRLDEDRKYTLDVTYETYATSATVSYLFSVFEDTLGAHPNAYYRSFTFDKQSGKELRIADIFDGTSYLNTLSKISREKLTPQIAKAEAVSEDELDTTYLESGTTPDPNNFAVFYFTTTDLVIVFPPYQVGPWVLGTQTISIPKSDLSAELKAAYR